MVGTFIFYFSFGGGGGGGGVCVQHQNDLEMTFDPGSARMFSTAIFEIYFSYHKDMYTAATDYYMWFHLIVLH